MRNIDEYIKYERRYRLMGKEMPFIFNIDEERDEIELVRYNETNKDSRVIEIPSFVTSIVKDNIRRNTRIMGYDTVNSSPLLFDGVAQNLEVIYKGKLIKDMEAMFKNYKGKLLKLNMNIENVENIARMFDGCLKLEDIQFNRFDTSNVKDMRALFRRCRKIKRIDITKFNTNKLEIMYGMFAYCVSLEEIDMSNLNLSNVKDITDMFIGCGNIINIDLRNTDLSNVEYCRDWLIKNDCKVNLKGSNIKEDVIRYLTNKVT